MVIFKCPYCRTEYEMTEFEFGIDLSLGFLAALYPN